MIRKKDKDMQEFSIKSTGNQVVITFDRTFVDIESLNWIFRRLRVEELIHKADFSDEIVDLGAEIKRNWWQKNKEQYLEGVFNENSD